MDKIFLNHMEFFAYHGVLNEERIHGQTFEIDVELSVDLSMAAKSDDIKDTVDYAQIYLEVKEIVTQRRYHLIETLASRIIEVLFSKYSIVKKICVRVRKPQAPIDGILVGPEVEIRRVRNV